MIFSEEHLENKILMPFLFFGGVEANISVTLKLMSSFSVCFPRHTETLLRETAKETNKHTAIQTHTSTHTKKSKKTCTCKTYTKNYRHR